MTDTSQAAAPPRRRAPWSRQAIGILLGVDRSVAIERDRADVRWMLDGPGIRGLDDPAEVIGALLDRLPLVNARWRRPVIAVALSADFAQQKHIFGLPPLSDRATGNALVREGAQRFFRRTSEDLVTSDVETDDEGRPMAAAFHGRIVRALRASCAQRSLRLLAIVPLDALPVADALASGTDDPDVASALRAAGLASRSAGARFNALSGGARSREVAPQRLRLALLVAGASVTLALAAPLVSARLVERAALRAHDKIRQHEVSALTTAFELGRVSEALAAVADRDSQRRSSIDLLAHLAALLPSGAALTHLELDSVGGTLIALAPSADGVLKGISESTLIGAPEIVGPVTRERAGARDVERLTLRFVHRADTQPREQR